MLTKFAQMLADCCQRPAGEDGQKSHKLLMLFNEFLEPGGAVARPIKAKIFVKAKFCDDDHSAFAHQLLFTRNSGRSLAMRRVLSVIIAATLLTAAVTDVVAAGAKTVGARNHQLKLAHTLVFGFRVGNGHRHSANVRL